MDSHLFIDTFVNELIHDKGVKHEKNQGARDKSLAPQSLKKAYADLSTRYRSTDGKANGFKTIFEMAAYIQARFPATYAVVDHILKTELMMQQGVTEESCLSVLDLGAGPGTATLAALQHFKVRHVTLAEQTVPLVKAATHVFSQNFPAITFVGLPTSLHDVTLPSADLVLLSYVLTEMSQQQALRIYMASLTATLGYNLVVLPGTPAAFQLMLNLRTTAIEYGFTIMAPCPHALTCPMIGDNTEWCHFRKRLHRGGLHQAIKQGSLGYEDEPYCYLLVSHPALLGEKKDYARVIQSPRKRPGHIYLDMCAKSGTLETHCLTKKNKAAYGHANDVKWGDRLTPIKDQN